MIDVRVNSTCEKKNKRQAQLMRGWNPTLHMETLDLQQCREKMPALYLEDYGMSSHCPIPGEDKAAIMFLDGLMQCRGMGVETRSVGPQPQTEQAQQFFGTPALQNNVLGLIVPLMQQMIMNPPQEEHGARLQLISQPRVFRGRLMRSLDSIGSAQPHDQTILALDESPSSVTGSPSSVDRVADTRDEIGEVAKQ